MMMNTTLWVRKDKLSETRLVQAQSVPLAQGQVRLRVEHFALTANNITYAAFGQAMNYWQFYPTGQADWGIVPVWGFATVIESLHPDVQIGERVYGYFPMADSVMLEPVRLAPSGFSDGAAHRQTLHEVYNGYQRCAVDPLYRADTEEVQALLRPLFTTSWLIDDFLHDNAFFGADTLLLSSASSKTAYGTAHALGKRDGLTLIGLTSAANKAFCESLGCYSRVLAYEELEQLDAQARCLLVDFAGNAGLRRSIHTRFVNLAYSCSVGGTHIENLGGSKGLPGPKPALFFAPTQVAKRRSDWGEEVFEQRLAQAWHEFSAHALHAHPPWLLPKMQSGPQAVQAAYAQLLKGQLDPRVGLMLSLAL